jgi:hypothetical protein
MQNPHCLRCRDDGIYIPESGTPYRVCNCKEGAAYLKEMRRAGGSVPPDRVDAPPKESIH